MSTMTPSSGQVFSEASQVKALRLDGFRRLALCVVGKSGTSGVLVGKLADDGHFFSRRKGRCGDGQFGYGLFVLVSDVKSS